MGAKPKLTREQIEARAKARVDSAFARVAAGATAVAGRMAPLAGEIEAGGIGLIERVPVLLPIAAVLTPENLDEPDYEDAFMAQYNAEHSGPLEQRRYPYVPSKEHATGAQALADLGRCFPHFESFGGTSRTATEKLRHRLGAPDGWDVHHLVEQNLTEVFGTEAIQNTANAIAIPRALHKVVTGVYNGKPREGTAAFRAGASSVREYVSTLSYAQQRQYSIDTIRETMNDPRVELTRDERRLIESHLHRLENRGLCPQGELQHAEPDRPRSR